MLVYWEVKANARKELIRSIKQNKIIAFRVAIENVPKVCRNVYVLAQPAIDKQDRAKVTDVATGAGSTLEHVKALEIIPLISVPAIERNDSDSQRIVWTGQAPLGANNERIECTLTV